MKTILLTGATGYLGTNLTEKLLQTGEYKIIALCTSEYRPSKFAENKNVKQYFLDKTPLQTIFEENKINIIIHTATLYGRKNEPLSELIKVNVEFPAEILSLAIKHNVETFINTDTILQKNVSPYALSKHQFKSWLKFYGDNIKAVNLRLDQFYGAGDKPSKFITWLIEQFKNNAPEINLTEGLQYRDFIYIDDVVGAYFTILNNTDKISNGFNNFEVGTNIKTTVKTLVETLKKLTQNNVTKLNFGAVPYRKNEVLDYDIDTNALRELGWKPETNLENGLKKTLITEGIIK